MTYIEKNLETENVRKQLKTSQNILWRIDNININIQRKLRVLKLHQKFEIFLSKIDFTFKDPVFPLLLKKI